MIRLFGKPIRVNKVKKKGEKNMEENKYKRILMIILEIESWCLFYVESQMF